MNAKQTILAISVATVLAMTTPAHAGLLGGGAAGGLGGSLGGNMSGFGGGFGGRGAFNGSFDAPSTHAVKHAVEKTDAKTDAAAKAATGTAAAAGGKVESLDEKAGGGATAAGAKSEAAGVAGAAQATGSAHASRMEPPARLVSGSPSSEHNTSGASPSKSPAPSQPPAKPTSTAGIAGAADQSASAGPRYISGSESGSFDAAHSPGSTSVAAPAAPRRRRATRRADARVPGGRTSPASSVEYAPPTYGTSGERLGGGSLARPR